MDHKGTGRGVLFHMDSLVYGQKRNNSLHADEVRKTIIKSYLARLETVDTTVFQTRITSLAWSPVEREPYTVATGDKTGNLLLLKGQFSTFGNSRVFSPVMQINGEGPGFSLLAIRFQSKENVIFAGMNGKVTRVLVENRNVPDIFYDTNDYSHWFTSLDVSTQTNTVIAGDTKGFTYLFTDKGELVTKIRIHKSKVLHCEFNPSVPFLMATSGLDRTVKLFDLRKFDEKNCLASLEHHKGCNVARFSPTNGAKLLTSDQYDEIRIYEGPLWKDALTIHHPHRAFQHITPLKASWYPLADIAVIGTYPEKRDLPRPIQFFDGDTGDLIYEMCSPKSSIVNLNEFSPLGDFLASGSGRNLLIWEARPNDLDVKKFPKVPASSKIRNALRGEATSQLAPSEGKGKVAKRKQTSDEEEQEKAVKRKPKRKN